MAIEVRVPTLGESVTEATVGSWFKQPGEAVAGTCDLLIRLRLQMLQQNCFLQSDGSRQAG